MEERSLKVFETDKRFFAKISSTISKLLIPTKIGINGMLISVKRNALLKAYESYISDTEGAEDKKDILLKKYEDAYTLYLESIDKYVMDSIYKKVKNRTATNFEENALSKYYTVTHLKESNYIDYKYRKQKYLLELDYETISLTGKSKIIERYKQFYISKMDYLYKGILKNYSVQLADSIGVTERTKDETYGKIFETLEDYLTNNLPIKIENDNENTYKEILEEYDKFNTFLIGKLDKRDDIEKKMILLGISRKLFTHSLPLIVAEQCYIRLLKETRQLILSSPNDKKQKKAFEMLLKIIEDYNVKLLSTKIYWDKPSKRDEYKEFWDEYKKIEKLRQKDETEYEKQKEILFIKNDLKALNQKEQKYKSIIQLYKARLVELGVMRQFKNKCKTIKNEYTKETCKYVYNKVSNV